MDSKELNKTLSELEFVKNRIALTSVAVRICMQAKSEDERQRNMTTVYTQLDQLQDKLETLIDKLTKS